MLGGCSYSNFIDLRRVELDSGPPRKDSPSSSDVDPDIEVSNEFSFVELAQD